MKEEDFKLVYEEERGGIIRRKSHQWRLVRDRSRHKLLVTGRILTLPSMLVEEMISTQDEKNIKFWTAIYQGTIWKHEESGEFLLFSNTRIRVKGGKGKQRRKDARTFSKMGKEKDGRE